LTQVVHEVSPAAAAQLPLVGVVGVVVVLQADEQLATWQLASAL
jgi:hypothetical protein